MEEQDMLRRPLKDWDKGTCPYPNQFGVSERSEKKSRKPSRTPLLLK